MLQKILRWVLLALMLVGQGIKHSIAVDFFMRRMPSYLAAPEALIYISGVAEVILELRVLLPKTRRLAGWGIFGLLIAVFPAKLQMALHPEQWRELVEDGDRFLYGNHWADPMLRVLTASWVSYQILRPLRDKVDREQLCRYVARPPLAETQLQLLDDEWVRLEFR